MIMTSGFLLLLLLLLLFLLLGTIGIPLKIFSKGSSELNKVGTTMIKISFFGGLAALAFFIFLLIIALSGLLLNNIN